MIEKEEIRFKPPITTSLYWTVQYLFFTYVFFNFKFKNLNQSACLHGESRSDKYKITHLHVLQYCQYSVMYTKNPFRIKVHADLLSGLLGLGQVEGAGGGEGGDRRTIPSKNILLVFIRKSSITFQGTKNIYILEIQ